MAKRKTWVALDPTVMVTSDDRLLTDHEMLKQGKTGI